MSRFYANDLIDAGRKAQSYVTENSSLTFSVQQFAYTVHMTQAISHAFDTQDSRNELSNFQDIVSEAIPETPGDPKFAAAQDSLGFDLKMALNAIDSIMECLPPEPAKFTTFATFTNDLLIQSLQEAVEGAELSAHGAVKMAIGGTRSISRPSPGPEYRR